MEHLLHRLYGVDAPGLSHQLTDILASLSSWMY